MARKTNAQLQKEVAELKEKNRILASQVSEYAALFLTMLIEKCEEDEATLEALRPCLEELYELLYEKKQ